MHFNLHIMLMPFNFLKKNKTKQTAISLHSDNYSPGGKPASDTCALVLQHKPLFCCYISYFVIIIYLIATSLFCKPNSNTIVFVDRETESHDKNSAITEASPQLFSVPRLKPVQVTFVKLKPMSQKIFFFPVDPIKGTLVLAISPL